MNPDEATPIEEQRHSLMQKPIVRQFVKFCIVGGSSFVIDYCVRMTLMFSIPVGDERLSDHFGAYLMRSYPSFFGFAKDHGDAFLPIAAFFGAIFGMANSFIWNRAWTFKIKTPADRANHLKKFLVVSVIGMILNIVISTVVNPIIPADQKWSVRIATLIATAVVAIWNFTGQRLYAFKTESE